MSAGDELHFGKDGPYRLVDLSGAAKPPPPEPAERPVERAGAEKLTKKANDEKISLTTPDAKFWVDKKIRERLNEGSILNKHAERIKETDNKRSRLEALNARRLQLEERIKTMKQQSEETNAQIESSVNHKKKFEQEVADGRENFQKVARTHQDRFLSKSFRRFRG